MQQLNLTLSPTLDRPRLDTLLSLVADAMATGEWLTLPEIRARAGRGSLMGCSRT